MYPEIHSFEDHEDREYTVVTDGKHQGLPKLGIQLYCLDELDCPPAEIGKKLLDSAHVKDTALRHGCSIRIDIYTGFDGMKTCLQHHRLEKAFRQDAIERERQAATIRAPRGGVRSQSTAQTHFKEPYPHIAPSWCRALNDEADDGQKMDLDQGRKPDFEIRPYQNWLLMMPMGVKSWGDMIEKGIVEVRSGLEMAPASNQLVEQRSSPILRVTILQISDDLDLPENAVVSKLGDELTNSIISLGCYGYERVACKYCDQKSSHPGRCAVDLAETCGGSNRCGRCQEHGLTYTNY